ncbi:MAG: D-alanyl-D-alanine carboxypeptidase [Alphaproteobacteria bacterium]|nr:MAG: D-alanyl-D-alanine carboxypeptidase [Alphaproteobacteria bacterium]
MPAMRDAKVYRSLRGFRQLVVLVLVAVSFIFAMPDMADAARKKTARHSTRHVRRAPEPDRYSSIVVDANTGYVLSEKDAEVRRYPASLTKMMTLYLVFEALENGAVTKNQRLPISANAEYQEPSKLGLQEGYTIRLEDAIYGLVTRSANDAAVALAEGLGGSEAHFARLMTFKAQQLGMRSTHFVNASGLHDPLQYSTARDIAILSQALLRDFPREYRYFSTPSFTYAGITSLNHNKLMANYPGMDGIKTGYVHKSGYNLAASAVRDGRRLIGVVFGGRTANSRNQAMALLLDSGFERVKDPRVLALLRQREKLADARLPRRRPATSATQQPRTAANTQQIPFAMAPQAPEGEGDVNESDTTRPLPPATAAVTGQIAPQPLNATTNTMTGFTAVPAPKIARAATATQGTQKNQQNTRLAMAAQPAPQPVAGTWAIQIGAYSSHDASMMALRNAKEQLPARLTTTSRYMIVPLMTNRGMIYRARLMGLDRVQAATACRVLQGSCTVLAIQ